MILQSSEITFFNALIHFFIAVFELYIFYNYFDFLLLLLLKMTFKTSQVLMSVILRNIGFKIFNIGKTSVGFETCTLKFQTQHHCN